MRPCRWGSRLVHDTGGQVLLFGVVLVVAVLAFLLAVPNGTQATTQKVRAQTAADVGAFSGSVWLARSLNLNANLNIGISSVYTWMTVLTTGEALAQALYSDTAHSSVQKLGKDLSMALLGTGDPVSAHSGEYATSIAKLDETALWLRILQDDISGSFADFAATLGSDEASRNEGAYPASEAAGGRVLVRTNDTTPLLAENDSGDALLFADVAQLGNRLEYIPTGDSNITDAHGTVIVSPTTWDVWAYYTDSSRWYHVRQVLVRMYSKCVVQTLYNTESHVYDSAVEYRLHPGKWQNAYIQGDSWGHWVLQCNETGPHTPFMLPNGDKNLVWQFVGGHPSDNRYKRDTVFVADLHIPKNESLGYWVYDRPDSGGLLDSSLIWVRDSGDLVDTSSVEIAGIFVGAESTVGHKGDRVRPRRVNPAREFQTVAYVWRHGASDGPLGLGAVLGGRLFPRSEVAPQSPLLTVAKSVPYLAGASATEYDRFFAPAWDVRLAPMDSAGVAVITDDTAYPRHSGGSFDNLEDLRKYVLLP